MYNTSDRVQKLVAGRRAGTLSLRQFKAQIESFSQYELAYLAAALVETNPARRKRADPALLANVNNHNTLPCSDIEYWTKDH